MLDGLQEVSADTKEILDQSVHRTESLCLSRGYEPSHRALSLPGGLMRDFSPVVRLWAVVLNQRWHDASGRSGIAPEFVRHESPEFASLTFQWCMEEAVRGALFLSRFEFWENTKKTEGRRRSTK